MSSSGVSGRERAIGISWGNPRSRFMADGPCAEDTGGTDRLDSSPRLRDLSKTCLSWKRWCPQEKTLNSSATGTSPLWAAPGCPSGFPIPPINLGDGTPFPTVRGRVLMRENKLQENRNAALKRRKDWRVHVTTVLLLSGSQIIWVHSCTFQPARSRSCFRGYEMCSTNSPTSRAWEVD